MPDPMPYAMSAYQLSARTLVYQDHLLDTVKLDIKPPEHIRYCQYHLTPSKANTMSMVSMMENG